MANLGLPMHPEQQEAMEAVKTLREANAKAQKNKEDRELVNVRAQKEKEDNESFQRIIKYFEQQDLEYCLSPWRGS